MRLSKAIAGIAVGALALAASAVTTPAKVEGNKIIRNYSGSPEGAS